ncbi:MAG: TRAP transporter large permease subunit, partial [Rhodospirillales bacterium]|nr:TRAP transporter large permease subunit [Rhodospirillales bacterium]
MDVGTISLVLVLGLIFLLAIGMPLGFASAALALIVMIMKFEPGLLTDPLSFGAGLLTSNPGTGPLYILTQKIFDLLTEYVLISVPLFIFMASLLERSGIAKAMYDSLNFWLNRTRGGIAIVTSLMAVILAAMSGIIGGEVVLLGLIALPQMLRLGYDQSLAMGTICASGTLGTMIPPSIVLIMFGLITETSIKSLFTGAFIPGFMLATFFIIYILVRTNLNPSLAPLPEPKPDDPEPLEKLGMFGGFISILVTGILGLFLLRVILYSVTGRNANVDPALGPLFLGMDYHLPYIAAVTLASAAIAYFG